MSVELHVSIRLAKPRDFPGAAKPAEQQDLSDAARLARQATIERQITDFRNRIQRIRPEVVWDIYAHYSRFFEKNEQPIEELTFAKLLQDVEEFFIHPPSEHYRGKILAMINRPDAVVTNPNAK